MTAAGLVALLGFMALAIDMGMFYTARADCQKIADAAALAGAKEAFFYTPADPVATARTAAISAARANYAPRNSNDNRLQNANVVVNTTERTVQVTVLQNRSKSESCRDLLRKNLRDQFGGRFRHGDCRSLSAYGGRAAIRLKVHQALAAARSIRLWKRTRDD